MTTHLPETLPGLGGVSIERDRAVPMRDGIELAADVYHPPGDGPHPVLLNRSPYGKVTGQSELAYAHPSYYAAQGYVVVVQDVRGRFGSGGKFVPWVHEAEDGFDTIAWAADLPDSTGRVGTYGFSYAGLNQLQTAALRPAALAAIAPAMTSPSPYEGWTYNSGAPALAFNASWAAVLGLGEAVRRGDSEALGALSGALADPSTAWWALPLAADPALAEHAPWYREWLDHPTYDDFWRRVSVDEDFSRIAVPALHTAGTWDVFLTGTVANFRGLRANAGSEQARAAQKLLVVPMAHMPWIPIGADVSPNVIDDWHLRFFAEHLRGEPDGVHESPVTAWVDGAGFRDLDDWPPSSATTTALHLRSGGRANSAFGDGRLDAQPPRPHERADVFVYDPAQPTPSHGGHSHGDPDLQPIGPRVQDAEQAKTVLVYTGPELAEPLDLIGDVRVRLHAASTATDTDWVARLTTVDENGVSTNIQEGIVRAAFRDSTSQPEPIEPGAVLEYTIDLGPVATRVPAGHRLRLSVASSDFPQWARNLNTGRVGDGDGTLDRPVSELTNQ